MIEYMDIICRFYKDILKENYKLIGRISDDFLPINENADQNSGNALHDSSDEQNSSPKMNKYNSYMKMTKSEKKFQDYLKQQVREEDDSKKKTVFEKMLYEMRNIENCLKHLIEHSERNKARRNSKIYFNRPDDQKMVLEICTGLETIHQETNESHSPGRSTGRGQNSLLDLQRSYSKDSSSKKEDNSAQTNSEIVLNQSHREHSEVIIEEVSSSNSNIASYQGRKVSPQIKVDFEPGSADTNSADGE